MNLARPSPCLLCRFLQTSSRASRARRKFHSSPPQLARKKPKHASVKATDMPQSESQIFHPNMFTTDYSSADIDALSEKYSPAQMAAIRAAESAVPASDISKAAQRADPWSLHYFDDLSDIHPVIDKAIKNPGPYADPYTNPPKDGDDYAQDWAKFVMDPNRPDLTKEDWKKGIDPTTKFNQQLQHTKGSRELEENRHTALAPELTPTKPKKPAKKAKKDGEGRGSKRDEEEASPALVKLMQMTGYSRVQIAGLRVKSIISHRVVNQTRLGKISKQYFLSIAGNGQGLIGIGEGKADEPSDARLQSQYRAIRNMQPILRYEGRTIYGDVAGKVSATELELYARPPGKCQCSFSVFGQ